MLILQISEFKKNPQVCENLWRCFKTFKDVVSCSGFEESILDRNMKYLRSYST